MDTSLISFGADVPHVALALNRLAVGTFFAMGGYQKLFNASGRATLTHTLRDDGVHAVPIMRWLVPSVELSAGCALIIGLLSALAALGLFVICLGALLLDGSKRVAAWKPAGPAEWLDDLLYLPEVPYCVALAVVTLAGPGPWSLDALIAARLAQ
jgi:putative oxidoreductase